MAIAHSLVKLSIAIICGTCAWSQQYTISTIAGTNVQGFSGDNGAATSAQLGLPGRIAIDSSGKIYIADAGNNVIRKVTSGTISTIAGNNTAGYSGDTGPATSAQLNAPVAVAVDSSGNGYIADANNFVIRKVTGATISTIVGGYATPVTPLNHPTGLALGPAGIIYIADTGNKRIAQFANGVLTSFAGNGSSAFSGDNGPATSASLNGPFGVAVDSAGNVYIPDSFHNRIRKVSSSGVITTIAGNGQAYYGGDGGPATSAGLFFPHDVAIDSSGSVYVDRK